MSDPVDSVEAELAWQERCRELVKPPILVGATAMLAAAELKPRMLVEGSIPAGAITLIVGEPGAKKSWLAYDLALAVAQEGRTWLGSPVTPHGPTRNVLVLNYDNPTPECGRRFKRLGLQGADPVWFHSVDLAPLRLPAAEAELRVLVSHLKPSLIVVDSFRQAHDQDENSSQAMAIVMGHLKSFYASGCSVVVVHHAGKSSGFASAEGVAKARGSGEIAGSADCIINVARSEDLDVATWAKHRSWEIPACDESLSFKLQDAGETTQLVLSD